MNFNEKLLTIRKEKGYSQEQLGNMINVTRQTVSNWELGISTPEMTKIIELAKVFDLTTDELLGVSNKSNDYKPRGFEYKSKRSIKGIPLVHINLGAGLRRAKGIIAIGNVSTGIISVGGISIGLLSLGGLSLGLLALGGLAIGLLFALGGVALGLIAIGGVAIGYLAIGGLSIGIYSVGSCAIAKEIGVGSYSKGKIAIRTQNGRVINTKDEIEMMINNKCPNILRVIKKIFVNLGK